MSEHNDVENGSDMEMESNAAEAWSDVDPEQEGAAPDEFQELELPDGRPVVAKHVQEGEIQDYRRQIRARHDDIDEDELGERVIVEVIKDHYKTPDMGYLTYQKFKDSKTGYYDKFINIIAPELANQATAENL